MAALRAPDGARACGLVGPPDPRPAVAAILERADAVPPDACLRLKISSPVPAGASLGTSAAVVVALLRAIDALLLGGSRTADELARLAHRVETAYCGLESGVQDQWAAAHATAAVMEVGRFGRHAETPTVTHRPLHLAPSTLDAIDTRLVTVVLGSHDSSAVYRMVIDAVDADRDAARRVAALAALASHAASCLEAGDLEGWGATLTAATDGQSALHPDLVGPAHRAAIGCARDHGALGWKVNGAGGSGGSLTALVPNAAQARALAGRVARAGPDLGRARSQSLPPPGR